MKLFKALKYWSSVYVAMTCPLVSALRSKILAPSAFTLKPLVIAEGVHCHRNTVYTMQENLFMYDTPFRPQFRPKSAPRKIFPAAEDSLITYLKQQSDRWCSFYERSEIYMFIGSRYSEFWKRGTKVKNKVCVKKSDRTMSYDNWIAKLLQTIEQPFSSMRLFSMRLQTYVIKPTHQLMNQLAIKPLDREGIPEASLLIAAIMNAF